MNLDALQEKITKIAQEKGIKESEIIELLSAHLNISYPEKDYDEEDMVIIKGVQNKILTTAYNFPQQKKNVNHHTDIAKLFNLDSVELSLFERAWDELESEGLVGATQYEIWLTEKGTRKARA